MPAPLLPQLHCWLSPLTLMSSLGTCMRKVLPFENSQVAFSSVVYFSHLQAQVWIPAQWNDTWYQNYYTPQKDWHPARLRELQTVIFQCRSCPAPLHIQLTLPALCPPLLCTGNTWYLKDTYWNYNTPMDCPAITCVLQLPHLCVTCPEQCPLSALTAPLYSLQSSCFPLVRARRPWPKPAAKTEPSGVYILLQKGS